MIPDLTTSQGEQHTEGSMKRIIPNSKTNDLQKAGSREWVTISKSQAPLQLLSSLFGWGPRSINLLYYPRLITGERVGVTLNLDYQALLMKALPGSSTVLQLPVNELGKVTDFICQAQPKADISCTALLF